jgi:hypothetical protein
MSNNVTLSLPLSATALRLGATLLTDLAAQTETIYAELTGMNPFYRPADLHAAAVAEGIHSAENDPLVPLEAVREKFENQRDERLATETPLEQDVATAEAETVNPYANETPEEKQFRLHGNVASAGGDSTAPLTAVRTQETLPPVQYETVVTGYAPGAVPFAEGHDQASYEEAGWTIQAMLDAGHLVEVTEQRPLPVAPGASAAPAPAPAAPAATGSGVAVDKDGLPWDSRIHSDAAEKLAKTGYWKTKKNLPDGYKLQIEAELKAVMAAGKPNADSATAPGTFTATQTSAPAPTAPAVSGQQTDPNAPATTTTAAAVAPPAPSAPAAPAPAPAPGVAPAAAATNPFATFTRWILDHKLSATDVVLEVQKLGLSSIPDLSKRHDLIPTVVAALQAKGLGL